MNQEELTRMVSSTQKFMSRAQRAVRGSATKGEAMAKIAGEFLPKGDPFRLFLEWVNRHSKDLRKAAESLGIDLKALPDGPDFGKRLQEVVTPILERNYAKNHASRS